MAESESGQEKSEEPTGKKSADAKKKGQIPRSKELSAFAVLIVAGGCFFYFSTLILNAFVLVMTNGFKISRETIYDKTLVVDRLYQSVNEAGSALIPFLVAIFVAAFVSQIAIGGWNLSVDPLTPKMSRMNPIKGLKNKMFSTNSLMELVKALGKFLLVSSFAVGILVNFADDLMRLGQLPLNEAMKEAIRLLILAFLILSSSLIVIVLIDVPFQIWKHANDLKMTKQEVKDEMKNTEGKPEVKSRIRQLQMEMAQRRMMENVPEADVVITNPTHFSVALKYDAERGNAPILVAKATDIVALKIREIARAHNVVIVTAPPLARSIYYTTDLDREIPEGLYVAVAQVLAYVYQVKQHHDGKGARPGIMPDIDVPDDLQHD
ncbi:MAG: flagellar biosynthesis protein FlhB [Pseudomonadales bacterium]|nr:flagellar biosynthesis protein FlhB [Pseudomonadales bacterium]